MLFVDGHLLPEDAVHISALDRGFTLGDSVFETIRVHRGQPFRLAAHLERLRRSGRAIGLDIPQTDSQLAGALEAILKGEAAPRGDNLSEAVARLTVSRGIARVRGLLPFTEAPTVVIQPSPFAAPAVDKYVNGVRAIVSRIRRNETSPTASIKSGSYLDSVLARMEAQRNGADDALFLNTAGQLACVTAANLFWVKGGTLCTPAITCGVLAGIVREMVIQWALDNDITAQAVADPLEALLGSDEAFLTNVVVGVMPLTYVNEQAIGAGRPGHLTGRAMQAYRQTLDAECGGG
ncbi:MAG: aminotransferase class IV [Bacteroidetes bacterium]|nr:aminotransferase class IV [Bacteroidota bacterium]MCL5026535.1 aminotransferase class IV [Chloroflexota bacterium]